MNQKQKERKLAQLLNTKILIAHVERAAKTINKFRNSFNEETKINILTDTFGAEYIYLAEFNKIRDGLIANAHKLAEELEISVDHNDLWGKK